MKTATIQLQIPENPFEFIVDYLDTDGYNGHFVRKTSTDPLKKLINRIGLTNNVNWIEIYHPRMKVAPADMPMGDAIQERQREGNWFQMPSGRYMQSLTM